MTNEEVRSNLEKESKFNRLIVVIIISLLIGVLGFFAGLNINSNKTNPIVNKVLDILENEWYSEIYYPDDSSDTMIAQFISSISNFDYEKQLDPYTYFIKNSSSSTVNQGYMGVKMQKNFDYPMIKQVYENTPAFKASLQAFDLILGVKKDNIWHYVCDENEDYYSISSLCSGNIGEVITLKIRRFTDTGYEDFNVDLTLDKVIYPYAYLENYSFENSIYVKLDSFVSDSLDNRSSVQMENIFKNNLDAKNLILDLRDNGGGSVDSMVEICDLFLTKNKLIMTTELKDKTITEYKTNDDKVYDFDKIIILMNANTASASEILISCLSYHLDNVVLIGRTTYGKGIAQRKRVLNADYSFQYTFAKWYTPEKIWIHEKGISTTSETTYIPYTEDYVEFYNLSNYYKLTYDYDYKYDMVNTNISYFQEVLNYLYPNSAIREDGYFDKNTEDLVKQFQEDNNLEVSGIIDENTFIVLCNLYNKAYQTYFINNHNLKIKEVLGV